MEVARLPARDADSSELQIVSELIESDEISYSSLQREVKQSRIELVALSASCWKRINFARAWNDDRSDLKLEGYCTSIRGDKEGIGGTEMAESEVYIGLGR